MQNTVLIIEQDAELAEAIMEQLAKQSGDEAHNSLTCDTCDQASAYEVALRHKPQTVILNPDTLHASHASHAILCGDLRNILPNALIIVFGDEANGAYPQADIRLPKPFHIKELLNAVRAQRQSYGVFRIGALRFSAAERKLIAADNKESFLTDKEARVLDYLCRHARAFVPRQDLLHQIWGYQSDTDTHTLETHIYRLRQKLGAEGEALLTEEGGYRLNIAPASMANTANTANTANAGEKHGT